MHVVPAGRHRGRPRPGRARARRVRPPARHRPLRADPARDRQRPDRDPARGRARGPRRHGRVGAARASRARRCSAPCPRRSPSGPSPTVIVVKTREPIGRQTFEQLAQRAETLAAADRAAEESRAVPARVERWFAEANFHHSEFADLARLTSLKEKQGLTVSLVLPTLNEAETIGPIVRRARPRDAGALPAARRDPRHRLRVRPTTRVAIAEAEGARVVQHPDVLPRYGSFRGKGEALWKSLFETSGDLVVWADTDVRNWHRADGLRHARPAARRAAAAVRQGLLPAADRRGRRAQGGRRRPGHRARRAAARSTCSSPSCRASSSRSPGEYAGRRTLLEQIPFFTGYAVEIGHLIDAAERAGIEGLGQVDLERRVHRNQELEGLSRMSFVILQAVMKRLEERRRARLFAELGSTMKLPRSGRGPPLARGPRAGRPRAAADDPDPRVPREAARARRRDDAAAD